MSAIDLAKFDFTELLALRTDIDARITEIKQTSVDQLRRRFEQDAARVGLTMGEVMGVEKKKRGRKPKVPPPEDG